MQVLGWWFKTSSVTVIDDDTKKYENIRETKCKVTISATVNCKRHSMNTF